MTLASPSGLLFEELRLTNCTVAPICLYNLRASDVSHYSVIVVVKDKCKSSSNEILCTKTYACFQSLLGSTSECTPSKLASHPTPSHSLAARDVPFPSHRIPRRRKHIIPQTSTTSTVSTQSRFTPAQDNHSLL
jgi:hypothetical protein